jgi:hypothetical protein
MLDVLKEAAIAGGALVMIVTGLVELYKRSGMPKRWATLGAVLTGIVLAVSWEGVTTNHNPIEWWLSGVTGIIAGLASGGLYSLGKSILAPEMMQAKDELEPTIQARAKAIRQGKQGIDSPSET